MPADSAENDPDREFLPAIRMGRIETLVVHQVSDEELVKLAEGNQQSLHLNFSIFLLSTAIAFTITLLSTPLPAGKTYTFFLLVSIVGYAIGVYLLLLWYRTRNTINDLVEKIRRRLPPEGDAQPPIVVTPRDPR